MVRTSSGNVTFNRTNLELKLVERVIEALVFRLLIAPIWN